MQRGEHLTVSGLEAIINIGATINKGLTSALIEAFPNTVAVARPLLVPNTFIYIYKKGLDNVDVKLIDPQ